MTMVLAPAPFDFEVPGDLTAPRPAELRGLRRDEVRLLVAHRGSSTVEHRRFSDLPSILSPGDLIVINTSATIPAALDATRQDGTRLRVHLSTQLPGGLWTVEIRTPAGAGSTPFDGGRTEHLSLQGGGSIDVLAPYVLNGRRSRLWIAALNLDQPWDAYLAAHGSPIRYGKNPERLPLEHFQNVYAASPGSAEMPSAGRAFTPELITALVARGVGYAPVILHTGVSSLEAHEPPFEERYEVSASTAAAANAARATGGRIIAVGTTVVRALETVTSSNGVVSAGTGWTDLVITPERGVYATDALLTGWHEPSASHLALVEAVGGRALVELSYEAALEERYLWHEFGDLHVVIR
jgi:S-adenosylmethionine:tRNA ribosyltransferase-isomerase